MQPPSPEARATAFLRLKHVHPHVSYSFRVAQCCAGQKHVSRGLGQCAKGEELDRHRFETRTHPSPAVSRLASTSSMAWPRQICANSTCIVQQCVATSRDVMHIRGNRQGMGQSIWLVQVQTPPSFPSLSSRRGRARSCSHGPHHSRTCRVSLLATCCDHTILLFKHSKLKYSSILSPTVKCEATSTI